jgi:phosphoserine phosphatase
MNLVLLGRDIPTPVLKAAAKLSGARGIERIDGEAFRLLGADHEDGIAELCEEHRLDHGFVPAARSLAAFRLAVMDMDSTLITIECIDEIADLHGIKPEVAAITAAAMRGEIDYPESLRRRVRLIAGLPESALQRVYDQRLRLSPGAEQMLAAFRRSGIRTLLVSGGFTFFTERLKDRLWLDRTRSNVLEVIDGKLTGNVLGDIVDADAKRAALLALCDELGITPAQAIGVGDGANDLRFLGECGVSIAYRAKPVVRERTTYALNHAGLEGVVHLLGGA